MLPLYLVLDWSSSGHRLRGYQHNFEYGFGVAGDGVEGGSKGDGDDAIPDPQRAGKVIQSA